MKKWYTIALTAVFLAGLVLLLYPPISAWWNSMHQSRAISAYLGQVSELDDMGAQELMQEAREYNEYLASRETNFILSDEELEQYYDIFDVTGTGIMAYIEIPKISMELPIYHGIEDSTLSVAAGHIPGSSLPVGGVSTHCVVSGHRGLPSATLFTDINQLEEGDVFFVYTLDETLAYEVDQIHIVLPEEIDDLRIELGEDLFTLVTCTPYGINTHRLLVRGHRVETDGTLVIRITGDATRVKPSHVIPFFSAPILLVVFIVLLIAPTRKKKTLADLQQTHDQP